MYFGLNKLKRKSYLKPTKQNPEQELEIKVKFTANNIQFNYNTPPKIQNLLLM